MLLVALGLAGALMQAPAASDAAMVSGRVLEQGTQAPVAGAQVTLMMMQRQGPPPAPFPNRPQTATTDENGRFALSGIQPGRYRLNAQKTGFAVALAPGMPPLELKGGERRDGIELTLQRGGVITGRVVDQSGEPIADARVMVLRKPPIPPGARGRGAAVAASPLMNRLMPAGGGAQTNDLGEFRLHSLAPGDYYVQAAPRPDFAGGQSASTPAVATTMVPTYFPGSADPGAAQPIHVAAGQTSSDVVVRMVIASASEVSGVVVDEAGQPISGVMVRLMPQNTTGPLMSMTGPANRVRTDAKGNFSLGIVTNGSYTLIAVPPVVIATAPQPTGAGVWSSGFSSFTIGGGAPGGATSGAVMNESSNGTTIQFRDDTGTQVPVVVNDASVTGLQVVVRRPSR